MQPVMMALVQRLWRIAVLVAAALCFLLAWFLDYDGLGRALGLAGTAGRIVLAAVVAMAIGVAIARFGRAPKGKRAMAGRKAVRKPRGAKAAPARKASPVRSAGARPRVRPPSGRR